MAALAACRSPARPQSDPDRVEITDIVDSVAYLRGLPRKEDIVVHLVEPAAFRAALTREMVIDPDARERERAWLTAFSFAPADINLDVDVEQQSSWIAAAYNYKQKRIVAPRDKTFERAYVAHEVAHALADQTFGLAREGFDDERAAWTALVEGDAEATEWMYRSRAALAGPGAALSWAAHWFEQPTRELIAPKGPYSELANWTAPYRDEILLRYVHGMRFVAALHAAGGFALVDRAWRAPPTTTEQILHPEKYLAGERAIPVAEPPVPEGLVPVITGTVGELGVRSVLSLCLKDELVTSTSAGWGGDAFRISMDASEKLGLVWVTAWDDEPSAKRFEETLTGMRACWDESVARDASGKRPGLAGTTRIERRGTAVVIARGIKDSLDAAFASVGAASERTPPLGAVTPVPFLDRRPDAPRGEFSGRTYTLSAFGLRVQLPEELSAHHADGSGVYVVGPGENLRAAISVVPTTEAEAFATSYLDDLAGSWKPKAAITEGGKGPVAIPLGSADERRYLIGPITVRVYLIPICKGFRTVVITAWWAGELNAPLFDELLANTTRFGEEIAPACR